jgi:hypothetical protein
MRAWADLASDNIPHKDDISARTIDFQAVEIA